MDEEDEDDTQDDSDSIDRWGSRDDIDASYDADESHSSDEKVDDPTDLDTYAVKIRNISGRQADPVDAFLLLKTVCEVFPNTRTAHYGTDLTGFVVAEILELFGAYLWCLDTLGFLSIPERVMGAAALDIISAKDPVDDIRIRSLSDIRAFLTNGARYSKRFPSQILMALRQVVIIAFDTSMRLCP